MLPHHLLAGVVGRGEEVVFSFEKRLQRGLGIVLPFSGDEVAELPTQHPRITPALLHGVPPPAVEAGGRLALEERDERLHHGELAPVSVAVGLMALLCRHDTLQRLQHILFVAAEEVDEEGELRHDRVELGLAGDAIDDGELTDVLALVVEEDVLAVREGDALGEGDGAVVGVDPDLVGDDEPDELAGLTIGHRDRAHFVPISVEDLVGAVGEGGVSHQEEGHRTVGGHVNLEGEVIAEVEKVVHVAVPVVPEIRERLSESRKKPFGASFSFS